MHDARSAIRQRFDERANVYDASAMHTDFAAAVAAFIDISHVRDVLDVATGTGLVLREVHQRDTTMTLTGIDLSPGMLQIADTALPEAAFVEGTAENLPFESDSFDLVTCVTSLHMFTDAGAAIDEWARVLRPSGRAITGTFGVDDIPPAGALPYPVDHHPFASPEALAHTVRTAGFTISRYRWWDSGRDRMLIAELTFAN